MSTNDWMMFLGLVFGTAFLLSQVFMTSTFGENRQARQRVRQRVAEVAGEEDAKSISLLKEEYLQSLSPWEAKLESLPGMENLRKILRQAGKRSCAYLVVLQSIGLAVVSGALITYFSKEVIYGVLGGMALSYAPFLLISKQRRTRLERFQEQFPEALDTMSRAMRAGHPYNMSLKYVSEELGSPISEEFGIMFTDVNYGGDHRRALLNLLERVPSVTVMAFVTAVLIQRDTGGDLTGLLSKLAGTVRARFKFQRTIQTMTAAGRLSGWILSLEPFALFAILWMTSPAYIEVMFTDPRGPPMLALTLGIIFVGALWIRKIITVDV
ncbi:MAG: tight adherence protein B [Hyphomicrobiaceae bacterium]|jgi:tight adherence protein B